MIALLVIIAGACFLAVIFRPAFGAYLLLFVTPLIGGIARGPIPLRPNEMLLLLVAAALAVRVVLLMLSRRYRAPRFDRMDAALLLLAATSSILPVLWRIARDLPLTQDDLLYALVLIKYYVLFRVFRGTILTTVQVMTCLWVSMAAAAIEAMIGVLQVFNLFSVPDLLLAYYDSPFEGQGGRVFSDRATSTLASAFGHADLMMMSLVIALGLLRVLSDHRLLLGAAVAVFLAGSAVSGEFSGYIGVLAMLLAFGSLFGGVLRRMLPGLIGACAISAVPFWHVLAFRIAGFSGEGGLPHSWNGRLENLERFFLPKLMEGNWLLGVQPAPRVPAVDTWRDFVYIECGYVWLLWIGGVPFFLAFVYFVVTALTLLRPIAKTRTDAVGVAAGAGFCYIVTLIALMLLDPHLTVRGAADLLFPLLAMSLVHQPATARARRPFPIVTRAQSPAGAFLTGGIRAAID